MLIAVINAAYHNDKLIYTTSPGIKNVVVKRQVYRAGLWCLLITEGIKAMLKKAKLIAKTMSCQLCECIYLY